MEKLELIQPNKSYEKQAIEYIQEFYKYNSNINGVGGLYRYLDNYDAWLKKLEEDRTRKLLLHKKEILKLRDKLEVEGYTLVPLKIYFVKNKAKVLIGVAKGKKNYNKKETIKERDIKREMERNFKYR